MEHQWEKILYAYIGLVEGVVGILTFGYWLPNWTLDYVFWIAKSNIQKRIREETRNELS